MRTFLSRVAFVSSLAGASVASAGTVTPGDVPGGTGDGGIPYSFQVELAGPADSATVVDSVGNKSWADPMNPDEGDFGLDGGWTHTSSWIHLALEESAEITFTLAPNSQVPDGSGGFFAGDLVPAMTLWSGADNDGGSDHFYEQGSTPHWVDASGFAFLAHADEGPGPFAGSEAEIELALEAGVYTLVVGGHDEVLETGHRVGYELTIRAAPEPAAAASLAAGALALAVARRLRRAAPVR